MSIVYSRNGIQRMVNLGVLYSAVIHLFGMDPNAINDLQVDNTTCIRRFLFKSK